MNETKDVTDVVDADRVKTPVVPNGLYHTFLLPVTVVAPRTEPTRARLADEVQEQIEALINSELQRAGLTTARAFIGDRLYDDAEVADDLTTDGPSTIWPLCG